MTLHTFLLTALLGSGALPAAEIHSGHPVWLSREHPDVPWVEPHLAAHPSDPEVLVGAAIAIRETGPASVAFLSRDGGRSWRSLELPGCGVDPWVAFDAKGKALISCHEERGAGAEALTAVRVHRLDPATATLATPVAVPLGRGGSVDQPKLVVDASGRADALHGSVYVAVGQYHPARGSARQVFGPAVSVSRSNGGLSFAEPVFLQHDHLDQQPFAAAVLADGALAVAFMDYATPQPRLLRHRRSWIALSPDGGATFTLPRLIREQVGRELPWAMAVDTSTRHRDRIYVVVDGHWSRDGTPPPAGASAAPLSLIHSDDRGLTWSAPLAISRAEPSANAETPAIAVTSTGLVGVVWYDTRHDPSGRCFDLYTTISLDGGTSFLPEHRLTAATSCPQEVAAQQNVARRWRFGGDYSGLASVGEDRFHALWAESRASLYRIWSAEIRLSAGD